MWQYQIRNNIFYSIDSLDVFFFKHIKIVILIYATLKKIRSVDFAWEIAHQTNDFSSFNGTSMSSIGCSMAYILLFCLLTGSVKQK